MAASLLLAQLWGFLRDSTPQRRRSRYGDMDYDWEHRVNTTSGTVAWRERLLGIFHSPYQPTDPSTFREMMDALPIDFREFTFIDIGSGKGRALLMAAEYPFRRIVGVELLPELDRAARENIRAYKSPTQKCSALESVCTDARKFDLPDEPAVLYLFNPLPEPALREFLQRIAQSIAQSPRTLWLIYYNPLEDSVVADLRVLTKACTTARYAVYRTAEAVDHRRGTVPRATLAAVSSNDNQDKGTKALEGSRPRNPDSTRQV